MQSLSQRAQPRVKYPADVRLIAPALQREVAGKSLNVSTSGIFVEAKELVEIGTELWCDLPLPGGTRRLAGKVARLQPLPFSSELVGLGIRFVDLDDMARALITNLVQREGGGGHLAETSFEGMSSSLRSQAELTRDGARLSMALPFLRPGAVVKVAFLSGPSQVASTGVVRESTLEGRTLDGAPRLQVEVDLLRQSAPAPSFFDDEDPEEVTAVDTPRALQARAMVEEATRARRPAAPVTDQSTPRPLDRSGRRPIEQRGRPRRSASVAIAGREDPASDPRATPAPGTRPLMKLALGVTAALACFALGGISARLWPPAPAILVSSDRAIRSPSPSPSPSPPPRAARPAAPPATAPVVVAAAPPPPHPVAARPRPAPEPLALAQLVGAPESVAARAGVRRPRPAPGESYTDAVLRTAVPVPEGTPGPALLREGNDLVAVVPFDGSYQGWRHYRLSEPRAVAVNLPMGRAALALGRHPFANEGFRGVWVREHEQGGIQIRFTLAYRTPEVLGVEVKDGTLRVRVAPAPP
jgi:hypothetical protein